LVQRPSISLARSDRMPIATQQLAHRRAAPRRAVRSSFSAAVRHECVFAAGAAQETSRRSPVAADTVQFGTPHPFVLSSALCALAAAGDAGPPSFRASAPDAPLIRIGAGLDVESTPVLYAQRARSVSRAPGMKGRGSVKIPRRREPAICGGGLPAAAPGRSARRAPTRWVTAHGAWCPVRPCSHRRRTNSSDVPDIPLVVSVRSTMRTAPRAEREDDRGGLGLRRRLRFGDRDLDRCKTGGDSKSVHFVELSPPAICRFAIEQGRIDGRRRSANRCSAKRLASGKIRVLGYPYNALGKHFVLADWFSTADWVAKNHDLAEKFARVHVRCERLRSPRTRAR